jgi:uncharacterized damage-inducible protein DinB
MATTTATPATTDAIKTPKQQFLEAFERETATTMRVLRAYPADKADLKPHEKLKTACDLAAMFTMEQAAIEAAASGTFTFPPKLPGKPETWPDVLRMFEETRRTAIAAIRNAKDEDLATRMVPFLTAPKTPGEWPTMDFLWFLLNDQIHHRGQLSVYLRLAGGKVPSIYGATADEPWM